MVTNSIKTLKMVHIKNKKQKNKNLRSRQLPVVGTSGWQKSGNKGLFFAGTEWTSST